MKRWIVLGLAVWGLLLSGCGEAATAGGGPDEGQPVHERDATAVTHQSDMGR